jgi:putative heme-binding domain-containing protein
MSRLVVLLVAAVLGTSLSAAEVSSAAGSEPETSPRMTFQPGDRVVLLGGTFAERLVGSGYFETLLVSRHPKLRLSLRSLAWPGDEVTRREFQFELVRHMNGQRGWAEGGPVLLQPRPRNFGDVFSHLGRQRPTVLMLCFGFNESFAGRVGLKAFRRDLLRFVEQLKGSGQPDASSKSSRIARRLVLVSPLAAELISPLAVEGDIQRAVRNEQLSLYSSAMSDVAREAGVHFVDLFAVTRDLPQTDAGRLTFNGVHLTEYGNWLVARFLASSLGINWRPWDVTLDRDSGRVVAKGTRVLDVAGSSSRLSFATSDLRLPLPPPPSDGAPKQLGSFGIDLPTLRVKGLGRGRWVLKLNGKESVTATDREWAEGVRLTQGGAMTAVEALRETIIDKNRQFYYRFRAVNGEYIYGRRKNPFGTKSFPPEMKKLDEMIRVRDEKIWYQSQPKPTVQFELTRVGLGECDVEELPVEIPRVARNDKGQVSGLGKKVGPAAKTKTKTKTKKRSAAKKKRRAAGGKNFVPGKEINRGGAIDLKSVDPEVAIGHLKVTDGFRIELFASEKDFPLYNPVSMTWDGRGRLWVSTMPTYPHVVPGEPPNDKLIILEDTDGDGRADRHSVFAENLYLAAGFELGDGGVYVAQQPNLVFLKDTDGDGKADYRRVVLHGFGTEDSHHAISAFTWGPGGGLYLHEGTFHHSQVETPYGPVRLQYGGIFRYEPKTFRLEVFVSYPFANPWGHVWDRWGQNFVADASGGSNYFGTAFSGRIDFPRKHAVMKEFTSTKVRPTCGCELVSSRHFPADFQGDFLLNNCIGFQGVKRHKVISTGSGFTTRELDPLVYSTDINFRPVDIQFGPDGALYLCDWFNPLIGHMQYSLRDERRDHSHGRIWRIRHKTRALLKPVHAAGRTIGELAGQLRSPEDRTRYRARRELWQRDREEVLVEMDAWGEGLMKAEHVEAEHELLEALWVMQGFHAVRPRYLLRALRSPNADARAAATRILCFQRRGIPEALEWLEVQVNDESSRVRLEAIRACSWFDGVAAVEVALQALGHPRDDYIDYTLSEAIRQLEKDWKPALASGRPVAAKNPAGLAYLLARLSTVELVTLEPSRVVLGELVSRPRVPMPDRHKALDGLAKLNGTTRLSELVSAIGVSDAGESAEAELVLFDLAHMLTGQSPKQLSTVRGRLESLATKSRRAVARQIGFAALISADGRSMAAWQLAGRSEIGRLDLLDGLGLVPDPKLRDSLYVRIKPLLSARSPSTRASRALRRSAFNAATSLPGHESEVFGILAGFARSGDQRHVAVQAISRIPKYRWSKPVAGPLIASLLAFARSVPARQRTRGDVRDALGLAGELTTLLPTAEGLRLRGEIAELGVRRIVIRPVPHRMKYDRTVIAVQAGKPIEIVFDNVDIMPHNLLFTRPGQMLSVAQAAERMATSPDAFSRNFVPESNQIVAATRLLQARQSQKLVFDVPKETGEYPFVCTFPNHWRTMNGVMHVVDDLQLFLARNPIAEPVPVESRPFVRNWSTADLAGDLESLGRGRSYVRGKSLFAAAACRQCHRVNEVGGNVGPDLGRLDAKVTRAQILQSIIEPSKEIKDKFRSYLLVTDAGRQYTGMILEKTPTKIRLATNPLGQSVHKPIEIPVSSIELTKPLAISLMPEKLVNTLSRQEILDLIAYIEARGRSDHRVYGGMGASGRKPSP